MEKNNSKKSLSWKDRNLQFIFGILFLIFLVSLISVLLIVYQNKKPLTSNITYIFVIILFIFSCLALIINSYYGIKFAKKQNNKKLEILFLLSTIFIIPFVSLYAIFASATIMLNYNSPKYKKNL
ncbi:hypothetical protein [Metamycoplasma canadense]|uniref:Transmembrane protein n=1 Tax=Metamycoplasma canadense TaxID=29554 RepID=A0A077L900_9BACT|nr:hypothetical protein [Metamycoplasma canadense]BAP39473.1 hypothetical protein MCAN360_0244 [Metamycoplasma canadense]